MTEYVILRCYEAEVGAWQWVGTRSAWSPAAAIRDFAVDMSTEDEVFVAIPARTWRRMRVSVKSEVRVTVEAEA